MLWIDWLHATYDTKKCVFVAWSMDTKITFLCVWYFGIVTHVLIWNVIDQGFVVLWLLYWFEIYLDLRSNQMHHISSPNKGWQRKIRFKIETNLASHGSTVCAEVLPLCSLSMRFFGSYNVSSKYMPIEMNSFANKLYNW